MAIELKADLWFPSIVWATLDLGADIAWLKQYADQMRNANRIILLMLTRCMI